MRLAIMGLALVAGISQAGSRDTEPIVTALDLFEACTGTSNSHHPVCFAYIRGFSDGNRWLLRDSPVVGLEAAPQAVCIPNAEPVVRAADLFVARFRHSREELSTLSPFRALSMALSSRYPCG